MDSQPSLEASSEAMHKIAPLITCHTTARETGKARLAAYLLKKLREGLGADDQLMVTLNQKAKILTDGDELSFRLDETGEAHLVAKKYIFHGLRESPARKAKTLPSQPSPENDHREDDHIPASPKRPHRNAQATGSRSEYRRRTQYSASRTNGADRASSSDAHRLSGTLR
jgi:hypothetical protein